MFHYWLSWFINWYFYTIFQINSILCFHTMTSSSGSTTVSILCDGCYCRSDWQDEDDSSLVLTLVKPTTSQAWSARIDSNVLGTVASKVGANTSIEVSRNTWEKCVQWPPLYFCIWHMSLKFISKKMMLTTTQVMFSVRPFALSENDLKTSIEVSTPL